MRIIFFCTELPGTAPSRCIEAPRAPLELALDPGRPHRGPRESWSRGAPAEVLAGRGVVVVGSWQAAGVIFVVGKVVLLTLHPRTAP
jgi:hypothetical protein